MRGERYLTKPKRRLFGCDDLPDDDDIIVVPQQHVSQSPTRSQTMPSRDPTLDVNNSAQWDVDIPPFDTPPYSRVPSHRLPSPGDEVVYGSQQYGNSLPMNAAPVDSTAGLMTAEELEELRMLQGTPESSEVYSRPHSAAANPLPAYMQRGFMGAKPPLPDEDPPPPSIPPRRDPDAVTPREATMVDSSSPQPAEPSAVTPREHDPAAGALVTVPQPEERALVPVHPVTMEDLRRLEEEIEMAKARVRAAKDTRHATKRQFTEVHALQTRANQREQEQQRLKEREEGIQELLAYESSEDETWRRAQAELEAAHANWLQDAQISFDQRQEYERSTEEEREAIRRQWKERNTSYEDRLKELREKNALMTSQAVLEGIHSVVRPRHEALHRMQDDERVTIQTEQAQLRSAMWRLFWTGIQMFALEEKMVALIKDEEVLRPITWEAEVRARDLLRIEQLIAWEPLLIQCMLADANRLILEEEACRHTVITEWQGSLRPFELGRARLEGLAHDEWYRAQLRAFTDCTPTEPMPLHLLEAFQRRLRDGLPLVEQSQLEQQPQKQPEDTAVDEVERDLLLAQVNALQREYDVIRQVVSRNAESSVDLKAQLQQLEDHYAAMKQAAVAYDSGSTSRADPTLEEMERLYGGIATPSLSGGPSVLLAELEKAYGATATPPLTRPVSAPLARDVLEALVQVEEEEGWTRRELRKSEHLYRVATQMAASGSVQLGCDVPLGAGAIAHAILAKLHEKPPVAAHVLAGGYYVVPDKIPPTRALSPSRIAVRVASHVLSGGYYTSHIPPRARKLSITEIQLAAQREEVHSNETHERERIQSQKRTEWEDIWTRQRQEYQLLRKGERWYNMDGIRQQAIAQMETFARQKVDREEHEAWRILDPECVKLHAKLRQKAEDWAKIFQQLNLMEEIEDYERGSITKEWAAKVITIEAGIRKPPPPRPVTPLRAPLPARPIDGTTAALLARMKASEDAAREALEAKPRALPVVTSMLAPHIAAFGYCRLRLVSLPAQRPLPVPRPRVEVYVPSAPPPSLPTHILKGGYARQTPCTPTEKKPSHMSERRTVAALQAQDRKDREAERQRLNTLAMEREQQRQQLLQCNRAETAKRLALEGEETKARSDIYRCILSARAALRQGKHFYLRSTELTATERTERSAIEVEETFQRGTLQRDRAEGARILRWQAEDSRIQALERQRRAERLEDEIKAKEAQREARRQEEQKRIEKEIEAQRVALERRVEMEKAMNNTAQQVERLQREKKAQELERRLAEWDKTRDRKAPEETRRTTTTGSVPPVGRKASGGYTAAPILPADRLGPIQDREQNLHRLKAEQVRREEEVARQERRAADLEAELARRDRVLPPPRGDTGGVPGLTPSLATGDVLGGLGLTQPGSALAGGLGRYGNTSPPSRTEVEDRALQYQREADSLDRRLHEIDERERARQQSRAVRLASSFDTNPGTAAIVGSVVPIPSKEWDIDLQPTLPIVSAPPPNRTSISTPTPSTPESIPLPVVPPQPLQPPPALTWAQRSGPINVFCGTPEPVLTPYQADTIPGPVTHHQDQAATRIQALYRGGRDRDKHRSDNTQDIGRWAHSRLSAGDLILEHEERIERDAIAAGQAAARVAIEQQRHAAPLAYRNSLLPSVVGVTSPPLGALTGVTPPYSQSSMMESLPNISSHQSSRYTDVVSDDLFFLLHEERLGRRSKDQAEGAERQILSERMNAGTTHLVQARRDEQSDATILRALKDEYEQRMGRLGRFQDRMKRERELAEQLYERQAAATEQLAASRGPRRDIQLST